MRVDLWGWAGKLWNLPNTLLGLGYGGLGLALAWLVWDRRRQPLWRPGLDLGHNAIQFHQLPWPLLAPGCGLTLGNVILYGRWPPWPAEAGWLVEKRGERLADLIGAHEAAHTVQGQVLGPFYLPFHLTSIVAGLALDGSMHGPHAWGEVGPLSDPPRPFAWPGSGGRPARRHCRRRRPDTGRGRKGLGP